LLCDLNKLKGCFKNVIFSLQWFTDYRFTTDQMRLYTNCSTSPELFESVDKLNFYELLLNVVQCQQSGFFSDLTYRCNDWNLIFGHLCIFHIKLAICLAVIDRSNDLYVKTNILSFLWAWSVILVFKCVAKPKLYWSQIPDISCAFCRSGL
jgi:hypothetical protein